MQYESHNPRGENKGESRDVKLKGQKERGGRRGGGGGSSADAGSGLLFSVMAQNDRSKIRATKQPSNCRERI